ncbi:hypothetical protein J6590_050385 [Homalodisca vitripennis]|nr:hypothetical protein J6590_050385 [Homalodisca vitripennis]
MSMLVTRSECVNGRMRTIGLNLCEEWSHLLVQQLILDTKQVPVDKLLELYISGAIHRSRHSMDTLRCLSTTFCLTERLSAKQCKILQEWILPSREESIQDDWNSLLPCTDLIAKLLLALSIKNKLYEVTNNSPVSSMDDFEKHYITTSFEDGLLVERKCAKPTSTEDAPKQLVLQDNELLEHMLTVLTREHFVTKEKSTPGTSAAVHMFTVHSGLLFHVITMAQQWGLSLDDSLTCHCAAFNAAKLVCSMPSVEEDVLEELLNTLQSLCRKWHASDIAIIAIINIFKDMCHHIHRSEDCQANYIVLITGVLKFVKKRKYGPHVSTQFVELLGLIAVVSIEIDDMYHHIHRSEDCQANYIDLVINVLKRVKKRKYGSHVATQFVELLGFIALVDKAANWSTRVTDDGSVRPLAHELLFFITSPFYQALSLNRIQIVLRVQSRRCHCTGCKSYLESSPGVVTARDADRAWRCKSYLESSPGVVTAQDANREHKSQAQEQQIFNDLLAAVNEIFLIQGDLLVDEELDEGVSRTATALHCLSVISVFTSKWRCKALFNIFYITVQKNLNTVLVKKVLTTIAKHEDIEQLSEFIQPALPLILWHWHEKSNSLQSFPWALLGYTSDAQFYSAQLQVILPVLIYRRDSTSLQHIAAVTGQPISVLIEASYSQLLGSVLPRFADDNQQETATVIISTIEQYLALPCPFSWTTGLCDDLIKQEIKGSVDTGQGRRPTDVLDRLAIGTPTVSAYLRESLCIGKLFIFRSIDL